MRTLTLGLLVMWGFGWAAPAAAEERVLVRSDHAQVEVEGEKYRLVTRQAPLRAVVLEASGKKRLVVNVVRLGAKADTDRRGTPLLVTVGRAKKVFPNRPALVEGRRVTSGVEDTIASYPVRYPLRIRRLGQIPVRVSLRRKADDGAVGVRLTLEEPKATLLTPLGGGKAKKRRASKRKVATKRGPKKAPPRRPPDPPATRRSDGADAGVADGGAQLAAAVSAGEDAPDAGPAAEAMPRQKRPLDGALVVRFVDAMGDRFGLREVLVELDDNTLMNNENASIFAGGTIAVFGGQVPPGPHRLRVFLKYAGDGGFFFSYLDAYSFYVSDEVPFDLEPGGKVELLITGEETGNMFVTPLEERPSLRFSVASD